MGHFSCNIFMLPPLQNSKCIKLHNKQGKINHSRKTQGNFAKNTRKFFCSCPKFPDSKDQRYCAICREISQFFNVSAKSFLPKKHPHTVFEIKGPQTVHPAMYLYYNSLKKDVHTPGVRHFSWHTGPRTSPAILSGHE